MKNITLFVVDPCLVASLFNFFGDFFFLDPGPGIRRSLGAKGPSGFKLNPTAAPWASRVMIGP